MLDGVLPHAPSQRDQSPLPPSDTCGAGMLAADDWSSLYGPKPSKVRTLFFISESPAPLQKILPHLCSPQAGVHRHGNGCLFRRMWTSWEACQWEMLRT